MAEKPRQGFWGLFNISFGFFGIQIGFALQNANMSRIFQSLGTKLDDLAILWIAAPLTGLLVQPIVGHMSDRTWLGRLGRRRPYFLAGAILAALSLVIMPLASDLAPQSSVLLFSAIMLWILDASLNISMEPFRAFVGDMLRKDQHTKGYTLQTAFIGAGAVVGSIFPYLLEKLNVSNTAVGNGIPDTVTYSFWFGGLALFCSVLWTVISTQEFTPEQMASFSDANDEPEVNQMRALAAKNFAVPAVWIASGVAVILAVYYRGEAWGLEKEIFILGGLLSAYGAASIYGILKAKSGSKAGMLTSIVGDFSGMPPIMKRLALVQFFSWCALFIMWIHTTNVVAQYSYGTTDTEGALFQEAGNWTGVLFAIYNGVAAIAALTLLPSLSKIIGQAKTHIFGLLCGALGYIGFFFIRDPNMLIACEIGIGIAWASILAMPYAMLASSLHPNKIGTYMGLFNVFVVIPQLLVATIMGTIMKSLFPGDPIWTMAFAAGVMVLAAISMLRVEPLIDAKHRSQKQG
jgi:maltose/moltooligosaccharide transporter